MIEEAGIEGVKMRSVLTCRTRYGVCVACYGRNLATGRPVEVGRQSASLLPSPSVNLAPS